MNLDFSTILVLLVLVSGVIWAFDAIILAPRRRATLGQRGKRTAPGPMEKIADYARSFFPVFLAVLLLRSFLAEPFRIPSGSMLPTLEIGDFILVKKNTYGIRLPVLDKKIIDIGQPKRGDVVVFRFPKDGVTPYIKRVIGLPGERIDYRNDMLYINGEPIAKKPTGTYTGTGSNRKMTGARRHIEYLDGIEHSTLQTDVSGIGRYLHIPMQAPQQRHIPTQVPQGHYFVMGDNRDNSKDSRFWGTVPEENLIGKAFLVWMNLDWGEGISWSRIGEKIR
ncbi:MAG: signal peptidase I Serine peptidase. MEROPS family S26A [Candidatus Kentron sp. G]|nr:MAG: signal peptidase I Serine peptidase. MEROPS family S26A [Candidatus Kentron sp. G]